MHADGMAKNDEGKRVEVLMDQDMVLGMHTMGQAGRQFTFEVP